MKMNVRKIFSIIICALAAYLFINMFFDYVGFTTSVCNNFKEPVCLIETAQYVRITPASFISIVSLSSSELASSQITFTNNMWGISNIVSIFMVISIVAIITIQILYIVGILKEKWVSLVNLLLGFISLYHLTLLFEGFKHIEATRAGLWIGSIVSLAMFVLSMLWYFMKTKPIGEKKTPVAKFNPQTGKPVHAKIKGYDPQTGKPIYE